MSLVTPGQLSAERRLSGQTFTATAQRLVYTEGGYSNGYEGGYADGASFPCSFQGRAAPDLLPGSNVPLTIADLYCAHTVTLLPNDRVKITHLYGELQASPITYEISAGPVVDGNVLNAGLRRVTT